MFYRKCHLNVLIFLCFFDNVENLFTVFGIDADICTKLLVPLLTNKARSSIGRLTPAELNYYDKVKKFL